MNVPHLAPNNSLHCRFSIAGPLNIETQMPTAAFWSETDVEADEVATGTLQRDDVDASLTEDLVDVNVDDPLRLAGTFFSFVFCFYSDLITCIGIDVYTDSPPLAFRIVESCLWFASSNSRQSPSSPHNWTQCLRLLKTCSTSTDISGIAQASSFHLTHISLSFTVISFTPIFMSFESVYMNKWSLICSTF